MSLDEAKSLLNLGFSVFVAVYLLYERTTTIKKFTEMFQTLNSSINLLIEKLGDKLK